MTSYLSVLREKLTNLASPRHANEQKKPQGPKANPVEVFAYGTELKKHQLTKLVNCTKQGLRYSIEQLRGPSEGYIKKRSVVLPSAGLSGKKKKFLMLDLDETLIHSVSLQQKADVQLKMNSGKEMVRCNIRPHCFKFLSQMSELYDIYIFTASTDDYCQAIMDHLNEPKKTILGALTRKNCLETQNGCRIKDLRIITNTGLQNIVIVDNFIHSFGLQLENGIPIVEFLNNKNDVSLLYLQPLLRKLHDVPDVRVTLGEELKLRDLFTKLENKENI